MDIEEVARALGRPVSHVEAMARGYTKKGTEPRPIPTTFEMDEAHHATSLGGKHFVSRDTSLRCNPTCFAHNITFRSLPQRRHFTTQSAGR